MTFISFYFQWFGFYKTGQAVETYSLFESKIYTEVGYTQLSHTNKTYRNHEYRKNSCAFGHCCHVLVMYKSMFVLLAI